MVVYFSDPRTLSRQKLVRCLEESFCWSNFVGRVKVRGVTKVNNHGNIILFVSYI